MICTISKHKAETKGHETIERRIAPEELNTFNACFIVGSAAEVTPVAKVGPYTFKPGDVSPMLMDAYQNDLRA